MTKPLASKSFGREHRIKTPDEYKRVYDSKQWGGSQHFSFNVLALCADEKAVSRLGISVSKRVAKQAVVRNRIKRQIREFYRQQKKTQLAIDLVISAKRGCALVNHEERNVDLHMLWNKVHKWQTWYSANRADIENSRQKPDHQ